LCFPRSGEPEGSEDVLVSSVRQELFPYPLFRYSGIAVYLFRRRRMSGGDHLSAVLSTFWAELMAVRALERAGVRHRLDLGDTRTVACMVTQYK